MYEFDMEGAVILLSCKLQYLHTPAMVPWDPAGILTKVTMEIDLQSWLIERVGI